MMAHPGESAVVLINPNRHAMASDAAALVDHETNLRLLAEGCRILDVSLLAVGDCDPRELIALASGNIEALPVDSLSLWNDERFLERVRRDDVCVLFLAGAWLEEEVLLAALDSAKRGYDVRFFSDLSVARHEPERRLVFDRGTLHGMLMTTVRQTLLEWAVSLGDPMLMQEVRKLLE